ncbi:MAG: 2-oxoglutarate dehydrogenase complex dihydrolipoyllysine-residue succinyltransferase [Planctomycetes bacterium]|nr:2-oxoglutarate dehydrogenase complex dihydrolipoyllysine-residue succinyltransferase [Planctomycetota bacterium]
MPMELKIPSVGESIKEVIIGTWMKKEGDSVEEDEPVVEVDSDKASQELGAPGAGVVSKLLFKEGDTVPVGEVIAIIDENGKTEPRPKARGHAAGGTGPKAEKKAKKPTSKQKSAEDPVVMPAARRLMEEHDLSGANIKGTGKDGRILKEDVQKALEEPRASGEADDGPSRSDEGHEQGNDGGMRETEAVRMSTIRKRIAERLVASQQQAAILTTFNEVDMSAVMALRSQYKDEFLKKYDIKLGFMSFFVKAAVDALRLIPQVNAKIDGDNIIFHNYQDIGVAVGGGKGLVVPVIRNAERLSFAEIEQTINDFGRRAQANQITPDEMQGGTFTISNGGVYGSMLSTPILNPPQSGILGMHNIVERAVVVDGEVKVRPVMYLALSYDHRIVDGREAVTFLKRVKECIESPMRMLMEV